MKASEIEDFESYDPNHLFDSVLDRFQLEDDMSLSAALHVAPQVIHDMRQMKMPIDSNMLIALHELTGISISGLHNILGERRKKLRFDDDYTEDLE